MSSMMQRTSTTIEGVELHRKDEVTWQVHTFDPVEIVWDGRTWSIELRIGRARLRSRDYGTLDDAVSAAADMFDGIEACPGY